ncbi:iron uptake transporter deferrochelatase/peroxidase subunit [Pseudolysinimonas sp.]|jgi:deferrochelatase/peroxidase EfeB|uniref:iron uptake transporter deferrochelatase/peroxidase subunit n=1 Tax=Pseudolysinimonas sp. TaxID=2680009 RepID=UPI003783B6EC
MTTRTPGGPTPQDGISRRAALGILGAGTAGAGFAAGAATTASFATQASSDGDPRDAYPFYGEHQAGITTPVQDRLHFAAFDLTSTATRDDLIQLLKDWTDAAAAMTQGREVGDGAVDGAPLLPPDDTGEALGLPPSGLTITIGVGPTLFDERFGLADRKPTDLEPLPLFAFDLLEESISGGDLCVQACAHDPQVAVHAIRNLTRLAFGTARIRWSQLGFGRTSSTSTHQATPRNLFGFKDGTANLKSEEPAAVDEFVWVGDEDQNWMSGGTYLVTRKIVMTIENWDRVSLAEQEDIVGRSKGEGAPLSGSAEFDDPDFELGTTDGGKVIPVDSHVRLAHPTTSGTRILRRGYNFVDGSNALGQLDAGLFFISMQRSPAQFSAVQRSLATDTMNEYIRHVSSAVFAIPPGATQGSYVGAGLFD